MSTQLPKISHWTIDKSQLGLVPSDSYKLAMPIEGTTGRMTTRKITNQAELLKEYSDTSEISPNLSNSILHALKLLQFMPVYTSRVGSTNVLPGRSDKPGADGNYTVFTDSEYSPYYKSSKFKLSHEKLDSIEIDGTSISATEGEDLDIKSAIETSLGSAYSVEDNGKLVSFINVGSKISSFKVDKIDIIDNSDWTENDLTGKFISLSAGDGAFKGSKSPSEFYVDVNGLNFKSMIPQNQQYPGTPVGLKFYSRHGNSPNQAYILNSWDTSKSILEYRAFPIYINDYLKSNGLNKPLLITGDSVKIKFTQNVSVEVIGEELGKILDISNSSIEIKKYSSYTPVDCGFKLLVDDKYYYIGVGNLVDLDNGENLVNDSNYYKLSESEFSTVDKLLYRLYEVVRYSTENSWLGIDGSTTEIEFNRDYLFLKSQLESYSPKIDSESSSESDFVGFSDYDEVVYSYSLGNTKYQLSNLAYSDQYITIKRTLGENSTNYTFYCGEYPYDTVPGDEYIRISAASLTYNDFISLLISALKTKFNATYSDNGFSLFTKDINEEWKLIVPSESDLFDEAGESPSIGSIVNYTDVINNAALIVVSTGINSSNILKFTLVKDTIDPELYHLTLTRKNDEESYVISFVEDKVDGYGVLRYLDYVNNDDTGSKYFRLVRINKDVHNLPKDKVESPMFGSEVKSCASSTTDWQVAINRFREKTGDRYDFIFDACQVNVSVANAIYNTGVDLYANALITLPDDKSIDNLIIYRNSLGFDHRQVVMRAPRVPDTTLGNFVVYMSPITQYLERLILNKSAGKEFAPLFGITNGSASLAPKYRYDSEEDRQRLCDAQIAPLVWDRGRQLPYFLLDLTGQRQDSNMSDVNNVRMDNLIAHLSDEIAEKYISRFNDPETRSEFVGELDIAIQQRLISHQQYRINAYKIICDETNNPDEIVEQRQFIVDIYEQYRPGIRWVKIYQGIYKLSQQI